MHVSTHLVFDGRCEAAFTFYASVLGGRDLALFRYGDRAPRPEWRDKIVHGSITIGDASFAGADVEPYEAPRGFFVLLSVASTAEAERLFTALAEQGDVRMPLQPTFWSPAFGVLVDRFGTPWEISTEQP
jgi:PhnB protein